MTDAPKHITETIFARVRGDLEPSAFVVFSKTGVAVLLGGVISLFICGQFGLGITGFAQDINHMFHAHMGSLTCAAICGSLFAIVPVIFLRSLCSTMQFRTIIRRKWQAPAIWLASFGALLAYHGEFGNEFMNFLAWALAAYLIYQILGHLMDRIHFQFHHFVNNH